MPYARALAGHRPYVVARRELQARLARQPLGLTVPEPLRLDPTLVASADFINALESLDGLLYGRVALTMPRWALYDCAALPGLICGFARPASALPERVRAALDVAGAIEVPVSMLLALPTLSPSCWLVYSLGDLQEPFPSLSPPALRGISLALGLSLVRAERALCVTQWASPKLAVYARFAPLRVRAAYLPAHDVPESCVCEMDAGPQAIARALRLEEGASTRPGVRMLDAGDPQALQALQRELEAGARIRILGAPRYLGARLALPIEVSA